jgi:nucleoside-diphosphate-sugar epimerase
MRILVTGGLGFIGSNFINYILKTTEHEIINVDKCDYMARERNVPEQDRYTYVRGDITEKYHMTHVFREYEPEVVIHFAAQSCVTKSFESSFQYTKDNVLGTHVLLETAKNYGKLKKFIHISTDEVYGEVAPGTTSDETSHLNPSNPYSASKAAAELYVKAYANAYKLPCIITRGNNVFGPQQYPEKVVPLFISQILNEKSVSIHGDGSSRRNFIYVDDVSRAVELILTKGEIGRTYNIGSHHEYSVIEIFEKIGKIMGKGTCEFVKDPRPFNDSRYCIDSSELRALGWSESLDFDEKLKSTVQWYVDNPNWY